MYQDTPKFVNDGGIVIVVTTDSQNSGHPWAKLV